MSVDVRLWLPRILYCYVFLQSVWAFKYELYFDDACSFSTTYSFLACLLLLCANDSHFGWYVCFLFVVGFLLLMIQFQYQCLSCKNPYSLCVIYLDTQMFNSHWLHHVLALRLFPFENYMSWRCDCVSIPFFCSALDERNHWLDVWEWFSLSLFPILCWKKIGLCFLICLFEFQRVIWIPSKWLHGISVWCLGDLIIMKPPCRV